MDPQPTVTPVPPAPTSKPKSHGFIWIIVGVIVLGAGILAGVFLGKQLYRTQPQINSYDQCVTAKDSIIQYSYPATCVTAGGQSFTQPVSNSISLPSEIPVEAPELYSEQTDSAPIANWETYSNNQYKFIFNYPKDWRIISSVEEPKQQEITVTYDPDTKDAYLERNPGAFDQSQKSDVLINGVQITRIKNNTDVYRREYAVIPLPNGTLIITGVLDLEVNQKQMSSFDQILSTFRFVE